MRLLGVCVAALCLTAYSADTSQYAYNPLSDTGCTSGATTGLRRMVDWLESHFSGQPWWGSDDGYVRVRTDSLHCAGRAVDWVMDACKPAELAEGNRIVQALVANGGRQAKAWGVQTIIFRGKIWTPRDSYAERAYSVGAGYTCSQGNTGSKTSGHWDHVHLDLNIWGSINFPANGGPVPPPSPTPAPRTGHACTNYAGTCELNCASPKRTIAGKCPSDPANVLCCYQPAGCSTLFCAGDYVQFTTVVNLRTAASTSASKIRASSIGEVMEVISGPTISGSYEFWNLRTPSGQSVWAARGTDWFVKYPGVGGLNAAPQQAIIPTDVNITVYADMCVEGNTRVVTQPSFPINSELVELCGKQWYEVEITGDTNVWYLPFDNATMILGYSSDDEGGEPSLEDLGLSAGGRAGPVWALLAAVFAAVFAARV